MEPPWSKREVIDAVIAEYKPFNVEDHKTWAFLIMYGAFIRVAVGRPEGRAAPYIEHELWLRIRRVWTALRGGRDPNAAYETPIDGEEPLTTDVQMEFAASESGRFLHQQLDELDREIREGRK